MSRSRFHKKTPVHTFFTAFPRTLCFRSP